MRLTERMAKLENRIMGPTEKVVVMQLYDNLGETPAEATARYEAEHGPIQDPRGDVLRVFIRHF